MGPALYPTTSQRARAPDPDHGVTTAVLLVVHVELDGEAAACDARGELGWVGA
jgi:hypothetical protein